MSEEQNTNELTFTGDFTMEFDDEGFPKVTVNFSDQSPVGLQLRKLLKDKIDLSMENGDKTVEISFGSGFSWQFRFIDC